MTLQLDPEQLKACIHCGLCLPACPTYVVSGSEAESPRGRLYLMKKLLEGTVTPQEARPHMERCLACHGCETACPSGVRYGALLLSVRESFARRDYRLSRFFRRWILGTVLPNHAFLLWMARGLRFYRESGVRRMLLRTGLLRLLPSLAYQESLIPKFQAYRPLHAGMSLGILPVSRWRSCSAA